MIANDLTTGGQYKMFSSFNNKYHPTLIRFTVSICGNRNIKQREHWAKDKIRRGRRSTETNSFAYCKLTRFSEPPLEFGWKRTESDDLARARDNIEMTLVIGFAIVLLQ